MPQTGRVPVKTTQAVSAAPVTATGNGTGQDMRGMHELIALLNVLVVSGTTPSMTLKLQLAPTLNGTYVDIPGAVFSPVTGVARADLRVVADGANGFVRAAWTISGTTPSFTFALDLVGVTPADTQLAEAL